MEKCFSECFLERQIQAMSSLADHSRFTRKQNEHPMTGGGWHGIQRIIASILKTLVPLVRLKLGSEKVLQHL